MCHVDDVTFGKFAYVVFMKIERFCALVCAGGRPVHCRFVVIVYSCAFKGIGHADIFCVMSDALEFGDTFVGCNNFGFA